MTKAFGVYPRGIIELRDPGLPLPTPLRDQELKELMGAAVESASLTANQGVAAELLNDSFFKMSPEASFLLRVSAVEALCPQADQTDAFRAIVDSVAASIPKGAPSSDRDQIKQALKRLAKRQSVRSAYMSKIKQLIGEDKAKKFDALYGQRSDFLHDGHGRGTLGGAANAALEIGLELLLADIAQSVRATAGDGAEARPFDVAILRGGGYQYGFKSGALMWLPPAVWPSWAWMCNCKATPRTPC